MPSKGTYQGRISVGESIKKKFNDAYLLALAPALGLFCADRYEAGRYSYLDVPADLIDLPVTRLISIGTAIAVLAVLLFFFFNAARKILIAKSGWRGFSGTFLLFAVLLGLPLAMVASTPNAFAWAFLIPLSFALAEGSSNKKEPAEQNSISDYVGLFCLCLVLSWYLYSFGYFVERNTVHRMCITGVDNKIIVGFFGERAVVKSIDSQGNLGKAVELISLDTTNNVIACAPNVHTPMSYLDHAFNGERQKP